jgi:hypothetical protein
MYEAIIASLTNIRPHSNADRLVLATVCGEQVIVSKDKVEGELGVYFPCDGALSNEMLHYNNLYSDLKLNADPKKKGFFDAKGRVRAQNFRGEKSYGFWIEVDSLQWTGVDIKSLAEGEKVTSLNGQVVCTKWVSPKTKEVVQGRRGAKKFVRKTMLQPHFDTKQLRYNVGDIPKGSILYITTKAHGTSGRTGHVPVDITPTGFKGWWNRHFGWRFKKKFASKRVWEVVTGTRRVVLNPKAHTDTGFYQGRTFRIDIHRKLKELVIPKGLTLYYEIVGYQDNGRPIMHHSVEKVQDKKLKKGLKKWYGDVMNYSYGCDPSGRVALTGEGNCCKILVYRATVINEDGIVFELPWSEVKSFCSKKGLETVHEEVAPFIYLGNKGILLDMVEKMLEGPDPLDPRHLKEGVCVRVEGNPETKIYKDKSFTFKLLEGIIKDDPNSVDIEEVEDGKNE